MKPFLITGAGRSGTRYCSDLLSILGIPTGWEATLNPFYPVHKAVDYVWLLRKLHLCGDANWLAAGYFDRLPKNVRIFHQTRHPLKVVRSMLTLQFFGDDYICQSSRADPRHYRFAVYHLPQINSFLTAIERCLYYWVQWNLLVERMSSRSSYRRYQFEKLLDLSTGVLDDLYRELTSKTLPKPVPWPCNVHDIYASHKGVELTWDHVPAGDLKEAAKSMMRFYGYED